MGTRDHQDVGITDAATGLQQPARRGLRHRLMAATAGLLVVAGLLAAGPAPALANQTTGTATSPSSSPAASAPQTTPASGLVLARAAWLGAALQPADGGVLVTQVIAGSTSQTLGLQTGDIVVSINGTATTRPAEAVAAVRAQRASTPARIEVRRDGTTRTLEASWVGRPLESFAGVRLEPGAVAFQGGLLRDFLAMPEGAGPDTPVVFFIQGVTCMSVESAGTGGYPVAGLITGLAARGIGVYRIEKPGMGDSSGTPACGTLDFETELAAFRAGYEALVRQRGIAPERIYIFGHSMGGIQAPILVSRGAPVAGIATFGTGLAPWRDYLHDVFRWQPVLQGADPAEAETMAVQLAPLIDQLMTEPGGPAAIAARSPEAAGPLREVFGWDGADSWMGRASAYWRQLGTAERARAWGQVGVPVLVLHGEKDLAVVDDRDERRIAALINADRPGAARFVSLPDTEHGFAVTGGAPFNPRIATEVADWIDAVRN